MRLPACAEGDAADPGTRRAFAPDLLILTLVSPAVFHPRAVRDAASLLRHPTAPRTVPIMKSFFPLRRGEGATLVFLIAFSAFAFIPQWRTIEAGGMAVFGWLIAALMLVSPALALVTILRRDGTEGGGAGGSGAAPDVAAEEGGGEA